MTTNQCFQVPLFLRQPRRSNQDAMRFNPDRDRLSEVVTFGEKNNNNNNVIEEKVEES